MTDRDQAAIALAKAAQYRDAADAPSTLRAYAADLADYEGWCAKVGLIAIPAAPEVVGAYLAAKGEGYAHSTLRRRVAAIARASGVAGQPLDTKHPAIRETLRGIGRVHGAPPRKAAALTTAEIRKLTAICRPTLTGLRDRALLLIGFAGALRRGELVALQLTDLRRTDAGVWLQIARSKTDAEGQGQEVFIVRGRHAATCPIAALDTWLAAAAITQGPIFRKVGRGQVVSARALSGDGARQIVRRCAAAAGLRGTLSEPITTHGLRAGFVTSALANHVHDEEIMAQTRHRSLTTMRGYVRRAKLGNSPPSGKVGL